MPSGFVSKYFGRDKLSKADLEKFNKLKSQISKTYTLIRKGDYDKGLALAEETFKDGEGLGKRLLHVDAIIFPFLSSSRNRLIAIPLLHANFTFGLHFSVGTLPSLISADLRLSPS